MRKNSGPILLFDGVCNLCNSAVQFTILRDHEQKFRFASLQSNSGQALLEQFGLSTTAYDSLVLVEDHHYFLRSTAALRVARGLGGPWKMLYVFILVPKPIRDWVYDRIAQNRYRWFGKKDQCMIPTPDLQNRFLD